MIELFLSTAQLTIHSALWWKQYPSTWPAADWRWSTIRPDEKTDTLCKWHVAQMSSAAYCCY